MKIWITLTIPFSLAVALTACTGATPTSTAPLSSPTVLQPTSTSAVEPTSTTGPVEPQTVTLLPSKDNTLYETSTGFLSNGSGQHFFAGKSAAAPLRRALIAFDIDGAIPEGAIITDVKLTLNLSRTMTQEQDVTLHRVLADWGEGASDAMSNEGSGIQAAPDDATWIFRFFDSELWETPGGDFKPDPSATVIVGIAEKHTWGSTEEMVVDVQEWLDDPDQNFGWLLKGNEDEFRTTKRFDSRENEMPENRPRLTITFIPPIDP